MSQWVGQQSHDLLGGGFSYIVLHGQAADGGRGLCLLSFDLLVCVFLLSHGGSLHHILLLDDLWMSQNHQTCTRPSGQTPVGGLT